MYIPTAAAVRNSKLRIVHQGTQYTASVAMYSRRIFVVTSSGANSLAIAWGTGGSSVYSYNYLDLFITTQTTPKMIKGLGATDTGSVYPIHMSNSGATTFTITGNRDFVVYEEWCV